MNNKQLSQFSPNLELDIVSLTYKNRHSLLWKKKKRLQLFSATIYSLASEAIVESKQTFQTGKKAILVISFSLLYKFPL